MEVGGYEYCEVTRWESDIPTRRVPADDDDRGNRDGMLNNLEVKRECIGNDST